MRTKVECYLKWNNVFRLKYGHENHDQYLEAKTNAAVEVFEQFFQQVSSFLQKTHLTWGLGTVSKEKNPKSSESLSEKISKRIILKSQVQEYNL